MVENQFFHEALTNADQEWVSALEQVYNFTQAQSKTLILDGYDN